MNKAMTTLLQRLEKGLSCGDNRFISLIGELQNVLFIPWRLAYQSTDTSVGG